MTRSKRASRSADRRVDDRAPPASSAAVREVMRANRATNTAPERALRAALRAGGLRGYRLNWNGVPGRPDITYPGRKVAIFVHGCFWHHCRLCHQRLPRTHRDFWRAKFRANRARDARKRRELESLGWSVLEVPECRIERSLPAVLKSVGATIAHAERNRG